MPIIPAQMTFMIAFYLKLTRIPAYLSYLPSIFQYISHLDALIDYYPWISQYFSSSRPSINIILTQFINLDHEFQPILASLWWFGTNFHPI